MNRFPDFQTDLLFSENPPVEGEAKVETAAKATDAHAAPVPAADHSHEATTTEPAPLPPQATGVLEPISSGQGFMLVLFGLLALCLLIAMTRFGRENDYGD